MLHSQLVRFQASFAVSASESTTSFDIVEDPQKVEEAVEHLMLNLPSPTSDHCSTPSPLGNTEEKDCTIACSKATTTTSTNSPSKLLHVRFKTAQKRPSTSDLESTITKRPKTSPPCASPVYTPSAMLPYKQNSPSAPNIKVKWFIRIFW